MGAPEGNKYGEGYGRPPLFATPDELQSKIDSYFNDGAHTRTFIVGKAPHQEKVELQLLTITGLAYYVGFESRQSFYDYEKNESFSYIIKRARLRIEQNYEELLQMGAPTGAIFALKQMDWKDSQSIDHTTKGESIAPKIDYTQLTDDELRAIREMQRKLNISK